MAQSSLLLFVAAVSVALIAVLWPYSSHHEASGSSCPLGYRKGSLPFAEHLSFGTRAQVTRFSGGLIWTGDQKSPWATVMEVDSSGIITHVGNTSSSAVPTSEVDLSSRFVIPGLIDPHVHLMPAGMLLQRLQLQGCQITSQQAFSERVRRYSSALADGNWVLGGGWNDNHWGGQLPDASWIDEVTGGRPAFLMRMDGHMALVNGAALRLAGINADTASPPGGHVDKDANTGQPTGILRESAMALVSALIPEPSLEERQAALQRAAAYALSQGVTSVVDMGRALFADMDASWRDLEQVYEPAADAGQLGIRVRSFVPLAHWGRLATKVAAQGRGHRGGRLFWGGVKEFGDGSLGSRTALMWQPYSDDNSTRGTRTVDLAVMKEQAGAADAAGLQVAVHAIGDRAVDEVLELLQGLPSVSAAMQAAPAEEPGQQRALNPLRHRMEHVQHISGPHVAQQLASSGIFAVPNPLHLLSDRLMILRRLGQDRAGPGRAFAYHTLLSAGVHMAYGSDWPVVDLEPLAALYTAACRKGPNDTEGQAAWVLEEAVTLEQALLMHTSEAARLAMLEGIVGQLQVGLRADFAVLSSNPLQLDCQQGMQIPQVLQTFVDGACVYNRN